MKLEFDISDITREDLVNAMAEKLLTTYVREEETNSTYPTNSPLAAQMRKLIEEKISALAEDHVREHFDETIKERISAQVDVVLAEGWRKTDGYGNANGQAVDLKGRINEIITEKKSTGYNRESFTLAEKLVQEKVREVFNDAFNKEIEAARKSLRDQLEVTVSAKFVETLKGAMGIR
jgi:hypothetical protein